MAKTATAFLLLAALPCAAFAQESSKESNKDSIPVKKSATVITASADAYYRYDLNNPKASPYNSYTSFTRYHNSFELGMASVKAEHTFGKVSMVGDLGFGTRAEEFAYNDANTRLAIKQLYVSYAPSAAIKFTLGSWATHVGYELVDAYLNRNYSMSYMFTNGPFTHTGIKADIAIHGKTALMVGITNPVDARTAPAAPKTFIGQISTATKDDKLKAYLNFVGGKQGKVQINQIATDKTLTQGDIVLLYAASSKLSFAYNGTYQRVKLKDTRFPEVTNSWWGSALYVNLDPVSYFGLTARLEYINDNDNYLGYKNVFAPTLSGNFKIDNLTIIPEFRFDNAKNQVFLKSDGTNTKSTGSFILAAVYKFN
jgi:hypothetical protein